MDHLNISDSIIKLRHNKGITQDELAAFLNVTKASVSKWETRQSYPDILLLPRIASYFDVTVDDLLGYEPQLSSEQIKKIYSELSADFSVKPFEEVVDKSRKLVKKYYSCYSFLFQIAVLWLNHCMLTPDKDKQTGLLKDSIVLCCRVSDCSTDAGLRNSASALKASANLFLGNAKEVIEELEPYFDSKQLLFQSSSVLISAYRSVGDTAKANLYNQITIYTHLLYLVADSIGYMGLNMQNKEVCEATIDRIERIIKAYDLDKLHQNTVLNFYYQKSVNYCFAGDIDKGIEAFEKFITGSIKFIDDGLEIHGDSYFDRIDEWFESFILKTEAPRNEKTVLESLLPAITNPVLSPLFSSPKYIELKELTERRIGSITRQ